MKHHADRQDPLVNVRFCRDPRGARFALAPGAIARVAALLSIRSRARLRRADLAPPSRLAVWTPALRRWRA